MSVCLSGKLRRVTDDSAEALAANAGQHSLQHVKVSTSCVCGVVQVVDGWGGGGGAGWRLQVGGRQSGGSGGQRQRNASFRPFGGPQYMPKGPSSRFAK